MSFSSFGSMMYCILCTITYASHTFVRSYSIIYFVLSYTFFALEVPVGTTEINQIQWYIKIFTLILYSKSYNISV